MKDIKQARSPKKVQLVLLHLNKTHCWWHIILRPHKARKGRQTQGTNPRQDLFWILSSSVASETFNISKHSVRAICTNDCCVFNTFQLHPRSSFQFLGKFKVQLDLTSQGPRMMGRLLHQQHPEPRPWRVGKGVNFDSTQFQGPKPWLQCTF